MVPEKGTPGNHSNDNLNARLKNIENLLERTVCEITEIKTDILNLKVEDLLDIQFKIKDVQNDMKNLEKPIYGNGVHKSILDRLEQIEESVSGSKIGMSAKAKGAIFSSLIMAVGALGVALIQLVN